MKISWVKASYKDAITKYWNFEQSCEGTLQNHILLLLILALFSLKHPRSNRGGLFPYQYFDKHTLICVRYTYVHDFFIL